MNIKTVSVIGANGSMGVNISAIFASFGNAKVYMISRNIEDSNKAVEKAKLSVKAESIGRNLIAKTYDDLEECVSVSDLVFESVFENKEVKLSVYDKIMPFLKEDTILATGTSGLSIHELSQSFPEKTKQSFLGVHFFNPPYNMILCEVIPTENTNRQLIVDMKNYLERTLYRKVVVVKDEPAFMGNRVGFQFINEALQYAENTNIKVESIISIQF